MYTEVNLVTAPYSFDLIKKSKDLLEATIKSLNPGFNTFASKINSEYVKTIEANFPEHLEHARKAAESLDVDPNEIIAANLSYDVAMGGGLGCSTMALATPCGPVLARNLDWDNPDKIAKASCLFEEELFTQAGFIGLVGVVTAQSSKKGFALCLNAVYGGHESSGYPMLLFLRHVLDFAKDYDQALEMLVSETLMSGGAITLIGVHNAQRVIVERTTTVARVRSVEGDEPLYATNHFRAIDHPIKCPRYQYLSCVSSSNKDFMSILTHDRVMQDTTAQHVVMCPANRTMRMYVPEKYLEKKSIPWLKLEDQ